MFTVYGTRTKHNVGILACLLSGDVVHMSRKGRLDGLGVVAVPCGAVGDVVAGLSTLETSAFGLAIIHVGTLVVHGFTVDILFLWGGPSSS